MHDGCCCVSQESLQYLLEAAAGKVGLAVLARRQLESELSKTQADVMNLGLQNYAVVESESEFAQQLAVAQAAMDAQLPFIPGAMTPSEVMRARDHGFGLVKLFPAAQAGGVGMLKALAGPLPDMRFCPTGGVSLSDLGEFLNQPNVAMVGGSWLTPADALSQGRWQDVTALAAQAVAVASSAT
jgi:hypothetical protein